MQRKHIILLTAVIFIGALLRFYKLGDIPTSLHRDEAYLGYNAYSILKTGRDMSGNFLPLHYESFLYSPSGYSYFSVPFIATLGLNAFSVRIASALFGTLTILLMYFLVDTVFQFSIPKHPSGISLLASLLLAISPWHINLSRTATENTLVVFFIILGVILYTIWINKRSLMYLFLAFLSFFITIFLYQAARSFLPLFLPMVIFILRHQMRNDNITAPLILYVLVIILPITIILKSPRLSTRINSVSVFATAETQLVIDEALREDGVWSIQPMYSRIFHNKVLGYAGQFLVNYFDHFSFPFLFTDQGLPVRYRVPGTGLLYLFELPLLLYGLGKLLRSKHVVATLLFGWILISPVGSALTFDDVPNLQRTLILYPALAIIISYGIIEFITTCRHRSHARRLLFIAAAIGLFQIFQYLHEYYIHLPLHKPWYRQEGYRELVSKVNKLLPYYNKGVITNRESAPEIFFLFYTSYNPKKYQQSVRYNASPDSTVISFGKYEFSLEECPLQIDTKAGQLTGQSGVLYVNYGTCKDPVGIKLLEEIRRGDQSTVFRVVSL